MPEGASTRAQLEWFAPMLIEYTSGGREGLPVYRLAAARRGQCIGHNVLLIIFSPCAKLVRSSSDLSLIGCAPERPIITEKERCKRVTSQTFPSERFIEDPLRMSILLTALSEECCSGNGHLKVDLARARQI